MPQTLHSHQGKHQERGGEPLFHRLHPRCSASDIAWHLQVKHTNTPLLALQATSRAPTCRCLRLASTSAHARTTLNDRSSTTAAVALASSPRKPPGTEISPTAERVMAGPSPGSGASSVPASCMCCSLTTVWPSCGPPRGANDSKCACRRARTRAHSQATGQWRKPAPRRPGQSIPPVEGSLTTPGMVWHRSAAPIGTLAD